MGDDDSNRSRYVAERQVLDPLEFTLQEEDKDLSDKLDGQRCEIEVRKIGTYKGRLDISARIVRVSGSDAKPQGQPKG